ncbi:MAG: P1 family peptidase [Synergistaceae bacterium]|jgi:D-aminopeptidase|nr:P1 family peptidase [Synergistaceae bacterium]
MRDYGVVTGVMTPGRRNSISDVEGVTVGHCTVDDPAMGVHTGATVVVPAGGSLFREKLPAAVSVFNGFGKSAGLMQIEEKGTLETAVVLTGVSSVGVLYDALFRRELERDADICRADGSVNPVVCECNDSFLNDARASSLTREHLDTAFSAASPDFEEGAVGAGRGMSCFQLKGGIGSASRVVDSRAGVFTVGVLVLANFGELPCLTVAGRHLGPRVEAMLTESTSERGFMKRSFMERSSVERGSIIVVAATDAPLDARQLKRLAKRGFLGVGRTGSFAGDGSGDIAVAFSTAFRIPHTSPSGGRVLRETLHEEHIDPFFKAAPEAAEEAILNALAAADPLKGRDGNQRRSLREFLPALLNN